MTQSPPVYDIFLSYAPADEAWVDGYLLDALRASGLNVLTQEEFRPGVPLLKEYERAVVQSRYVVLVLSPAWTGDRFGEFVDLLATFHGNREGSWPVVPLILQPVELPLRLKHQVEVDATTPERWPAALEKIARLLDAPLAPAQEVPDCPYPGMTPFTTEQESLFFGRDREIADAVKRLRLHPFLCVIGPSGSGKSSLVYAGVIPALGRSRQFGSGGWDICTLRPGAKPLTALGVETQNFASLQSAPLPGNRTLLFIDQFEELFTQSDPAQIQPFLDALQALIGQPNLHILLTVRADFYPELMDCTLWPAIGANRLDLPPLGRAELAAAIVQPAAQVEVSVDPLLVERLTGDAAGEKGALPLVQECLRLLWQGVARRYLPAAAYAGMAEGERNGLQIAIDRRASVVYSNLPTTAQPIARRIFLRLIQFGEGRADTRRQVAETDLRATGDDPALFASTLQTLIDRRLLTASGGEGETTRRVDIAHEALIGGWALLRGWIGERRTAEQTRRRLESTAQRWEELERAGGLLDPVELDGALRWLAQPDSQEVGGASDSLMGLIEASETHIRATEKEKEAAYQRELDRIMELQEVAFVISHRLSNAIGDIPYNLDIARRDDTDLSSDRLTALDRIQRRIASIFGLVEKLTAITGLGHIPFMQLDLRCVVEQACQLVLPSGNIQFKPPLWKHALWISGNQEILCDAFQSVIENGCEAMRGEGTLALSYQIEERQIKVSVVDTGPGIPPDLLSRIFDLGFSTKDRSSALRGGGLFGCRLIFRRHRGDIRCFSVVGEGTTFIISLPLLVLEG